jgi:hypothetical protein
MHTAVGDPKRAAAVHFNTAETIDGDSEPQTFHVTALRVRERACHSQVVQGPLLKRSFDSRIVATSNDLIGAFAVAAARVVFGGMGRAAPTLKSFSLLTSWHFVPCCLQGQQYFSTFSAAACFQTWRNRGELQQTVPSLTAFT